MPAESELEWRQLTSGLPTQKIEELENYANHLLEKTLDMLFQTMDKRDPLTAGHSIRVNRYCLLIGDRMSISPNERQVLHYAALLHDYGKVGVPEAILWKNGAPLPEEEAVIATHAKLTHDLLKQLPFTPALADIPWLAACHHEKLDGSGYPRSLAGDEIPLLARIIAVANVFDNLSSVRHYRERTPITAVDEVLQAQREKQLDARAIDALYDLSADQVLEVMESERGQQLPDLGAFKTVKWKRLIGLCQGQKPTADEANVVETFNRIYGSNPLCAKSSPD